MSGVDDDDEGRSDGGVRCARNGCSDSTCPRPIHLAVSVFSVLGILVQVWGESAYTGEEAELDDARLPLLATLLLLAVVLVRALLPRDPVAEPDFPRVLQRVDRRARPARGGAEREGRPFFAWGSLGRGCGWRRRTPRGRRRRAQSRRAAGRGQGRERRRRRARSARARVGRQQRRASAHAGPGIGVLAGVEWAACGTREREGRVRGRVRVARAVAAALVKVVRRPRPAARDGWTGGRNPGEQLGCHAARSCCLPATRHRVRLSHTRGRCPGCAAARSRPPRTRQHLARVLDYPPLLSLPPRSLRSNARPSRPSASSDVFLQQRLTRSAAPAPRSGASSSSSAVRPRSPLPSGSPVLTDGVSHLDPDGACGYAAASQSPDPS